MGNRSSKKGSRSRRAKSATASLPYVSRGHLLTPGERRFYHQGLAPAIGDRYLISFKVRLADVITVQDWNSRHGRRIAQKHLDFVLTTPKTTRIVAAIELNDSTHDGPNRQRRDDFLLQALRSAGIPLIAIPIYQTYDRQKIKRWITAAISAERRRCPLGRR